MAMPDAYHATGVSLNMFARTKRQWCVASVRHIRTRLTAAICLSLGPFGPRLALATHDCSEGKSPPYKISWTIMTILVGAGVLLSVRLWKRPGGFFASRVLPILAALGSIFLAFTIVGLLGVTGLCLPND